jgi:Fe-S oxidoreductase
LFLTLERGSNSLGRPASERDSFIQKAGLPYFDGSQEYCLWLGCMGSYDPKGREIVVSLARILDYLGTSYGVLRKEKCTGDSARRLGNDLLFQQLAEANLQTLAENNVKKILSICPHCVRTIQEDWKEYGAPPLIGHHSEFLARFAEELPSQRNSCQVELHPNQPLSSSANLLTCDPREARANLLPLSNSRPQAPLSIASEETIVYHDPCYLGRYRNVYDQPRAIVAQAGQLVEAPRSRDHSFCCGAGGGLAFLGEETGQRVSSVRAAELVATGATTVATACPFCNSVFRDALAAAGDAAPQLLDIAQLTARALPPGGKS